MQQAAARGAGGRLRDGVAAGFAAVAALQLWPLARWPIERLVAHGFYRDDAFFYATLAARFPDLGFLSFDGESPANGVQPLWMGLLLVLHGLLPGVDPTLLLARMSWAVYALFVFLATRWLWRGAPAPALASAAVFGAGVSLNPAFQYWVVQGLETPLLLVLLTWLVSALDRSDDSTAGLPWRLVVALALASSGCFLTRLDLFWLPAATGVWLALRRRPGPARLAAFAAVSAAIALPYLIGNWIAFGSPVPLSGRVKLYYLELVYPTLSDYLASEEWEGLFHAFASLLSTRPRPAMGVAVPVVVAVLGGTLAVALRDALRDEGARRLGAGLHVLAGALGLHVLFLYGVYRELRPYSSYYFVPEVVLVGLVCARRLPARATRVAIAASVAVVAAASAGRLATLEPLPYWRSQLAAVEAVRGLPDDATVGAFWPGALGALSGRPILPLDGIIGSPEFFAGAVRRGLELDRLLAGPRPHLAIYLHRTPEALLGSDVPPDLEGKWNHLGEHRLWQYRDCEPEVLFRDEIKDDGTGWYVLRFDEAGLAACRARVRAERPDVFVVVTDTLRRDRLELYGHDRENAPFLARLGTESAVFDNAFSTSSWTAPATASLFTGRYPAAHGVRMGIHAHQRMVERIEAQGEATLPLNQLPESFARLPELMRARGYGTFGVSTNRNVGDHMGFTRGFDRFEREGMASAGWVHELLLGWKRDILRSRPFFLYLHLNDVHAPYEPRAPWYEPTGDERGDVRAAYESEIRYLDGVLEALARDFDPHGDVVWLVVADHGEEFWERGELGHHLSLHAEVNRIPLLLRAPLRGVSPRRVRQNVSLVDVLPTLLEIAGPGPLPDTLDGVSLLPLVQEDRDERVSLATRLATRPLYAHRVDERGSGEELWAVIRGRWKLIQGDEASRLYDLVSDPAERDDRSDRAPDRASALAAALDAHRAGARPSEAGGGFSIDRERLEELRQLGYAEEAP